MPDDGVFDVDVARSVVTAFAGLMVFKGGRREKHDLLWERG